MEKGRKVLDRLHHPLYCFFFPSSHTHTHTPFLQDKFLSFTAATAAAEAAAATVARVGGHSEEESHPQKKKCQHLFSLSSPFSITLYIGRAAFSPPSHPSPNPLLLLPQKVGCKNFYDLRGEGRGGGDRRRRRREKKAFLLSVGGEDGRSAFSKAVEKQGRLEF